MELSEQVAHLFLLALPIACITWTKGYAEKSRVMNSEIILNKRKLQTHNVHECTILFMVGQLII